jgi:hypothetical protein
MNPNDGKEVLYHLPVRSGCRPSLLMQWFAPRGYDMMGRNRFFSAPSPRHIERILSVTAVRNSW